MHAIVFLIVIGVLVALGFLAAFIWAVKSGQYEDDYGPAVRILFDDKKGSRKNHTEEVREQSGSKTDKKNKTP